MTGRLCHGTITVFFSKSWRKCLKPHLITILVEGDERRVENDIDFFFFLKRKKTTLIIDKGEEILNLRLYSME